MTRTDKDLQCQHGLVFSRHIHYSRRDELQVQTLKSYRDGELQKNKKHGKVLELRLTVSTWVLIFNTYVIRLEPSIKYKTAFKLLRVSFFKTAILSCSKVNMSPDYVVMNCEMRILKLFLSRKLFVQAEVKELKYTGFGFLKQVLSHAIFCS